MSPRIIACLILRAPRLGAVKTRLAAEVGPESALAIYRALAKRQVRQIPSEWTLAIHFDPPEAREEIEDWITSICPGRDVHFHPQASGNLSERLERAMLDAFAAGAEQAFVLGADCPGLESAYLRCAADGLARCDCVISPALDGGYNTLGLKSAPRGFFRAIDWGTAHVLGQTRSRLREAGLAWRELDPLEDVDDLLSWRRAAAAHPTLSITGEEHDMRSLPPTQAR